jgi:hypothetical protein
MWVGRDAFFLIHPDDLPSSNDFWRTMLQRTRATATFRYRHASGAWRWIDVMSGQSSRATN